MPSQDVLDAQPPSAGAEIAHAGRIRDWHASGRGRARTWRSHRPLDVHMHRLRPIARVEEESVGPYWKDGRHRAPSARLNSVPRSPLANVWLLSDLLKQDERGSYPTVARAGRI